MAQLPRYEATSTSLLSGDIPRMDYSPMAEGTGLTGSISTALDKLSAFALGKVKAEKEQQNKMLAIQVRMQLESDLQVQSAQINEKIANNEYESADQVQTDFAKFRGGAVALAGLSPDQANGFMNSVAGFSKASILAFSKRKTDQIFAQKDVEVDRLIDTVASNIGVALDNLENDGDRMAYIAGARGVVAANAAMTSNPQEKMRAFEKLFQDEVASSMSRQFTSEKFAPNMAIALGKLAKNDAGSYTAMWGEMTQQQKDAVKIRMKKSFSDSNDVLKAQADALKSQDEGLARTLISDYFANPNPETLKQLDVIAKRSGAVSPEYVAELPNKAANAEPRNIAGEMKLKDEIEAGLINDLPTLQRRGMELNVGIRRIAEIQGSIYKTDRAINSRVEKIARAQAKLVPGIVNVSKAQTEDYFSFLASVEKQYKDDFAKWDGAGRVGSPPSKEDIANAIVTKRRDSSIQKKIDAITERMKENYGVNGKQHKSSIDLPELAMSFDDAGNVIGLHKDSIAALRAAKYTDPQIDEIRQNMIAIERLKEQLRNIR